MSCILYLDNCTKLYKFKKNNNDNTYNLYYFIKYQGRYVPIINSVLTNYKNITENNKNLVVNYLKLFRSLPNNINDIINYFN